MLFRLHKYWLQEFFRFFLIIQVIILVLFIIIDYLSRLDKFLDSDLSLLGGFGYVCLKLPFMFIQLTPASILLSTITVFALMNRNNELLAIRASGISGYTLIRPVVAVGFVLALFMFFLGETIVPVTMAKANYIKHYEIKKHKNQIFSAKKDIWIKSDHQIVHINYFDPVEKSVSGITITTLGPDFSLEKRIDARKGIFQDGQWVLSDLIEQTHSKDASDYDVKHRDHLIVPAAFKPADLGEVAKKSNEMSYFELKEYVGKVQAEGYNAVTYIVDLNAKIAFPFICVIMALTGAVIGMRTFAGNNLPLAIAAGVLVAFVYWIMYGFCLSLGYGRVLPPLIGAWAANLFFSVFTLLYLVNTE